MIEEWRTVTDFPNYEISNLCRLRNSRGKILRPVYDPSCRYVRYCMRYNGKQLTKNAHRVMWRAFHGEIASGYVLNHKDGNRQNNAMTNLEVVTHKENSQHAVAMGLVKMGDQHHARISAKRGDPRPARLTPERVKAIMDEFSAVDVVFTQIAAKHGVSRETVARIFKGKTWSTLTRRRIESQR